jgi:hypothetical protein
MARISWQGMDRGIYEDMVSVLLSILYPTAERIDGSGGDGGRDAQIRIPGRLDIFELKSFAGRLNINRRQQVTSSLERAKALNPDSWALVLPIDHTPGELKWFDELRNRAAFPINWLGKSWLDARMAEFPYVPRYFLWGGADEAFEKLKELREEQAALARGVPDAVERLKVLAKRLNELDPYYIFDITVGASGTRVAVRPRFLGADREKPILVNVQGEFPQTAEGRAALRHLQEALDYGTATTLQPQFVKSVSIEAPAGLGGLFEHIGIEMSPVNEESWRVPARLIAIAPGGRHVSSLPVVFDRRSAGQRGGTLSGHDHTGTLTFQLRVDRVEKQGEGSPFSFQFHQPDDALLGTLLPILYMLRAMQLPNTVQLEIEGNVVGKVVPPDTKLLPDGFLELMEALNRIQVATGTYFPVPARFEPADLREIAQADKLLKGQLIRQAWESITVTVDANPEVESLIRTDPVANYRYVVDYAATIAGREVPLGPAAITLQQARLQNQKDLEARFPVAPGTELELQFVPETGEPAEVALA